jgi:hypothetical protein
VIVGADGAAAAVEEEDGDVVAGAVVVDVGPARRSETGAVEASPGQPGPLPPVAPKRSRTCRRIPRELGATWYADRARERFQPAETALTTPRLNSGALRRE